MKTLTLEDSPSLQQAARPSSLRPSVRWTGRVLAGLPLLFLTWDAAMKLAAVPQVIEASAKLGFGRNSLTCLGIIELLAVVLTAVSRTRALGALLLTAYLGGAVAIHVQRSDPLFTHLLFPVYFGIMIWGGLCLLDPRVRAVSPFERR